MRTFIIIISLSFAAVVSNAQDLLPTDDSGMITYREVVQLHGYPASLLYKNARKFIKELAVRAERTKYYQEFPDSMRVSNKGSYAMSNVYTIGKRTDGIVLFDMSVEVKEGRYRYTICNLAFREFERNRYGKFVPVNARDTPLETPPSKLSRKQWEANQEKADEKIRQLIVDLQLAMARTPESDTAKRKTKTNDDW